MAATLNPGIKAVHLVLSRPTYTRPNNTTDTRDDLVSVRVWYSKLGGASFNPSAAYNAVTNPWILYSQEGGLITTIDGLEEDITYYVKYAYISKIDPDTFTISSELSAKTLASGVHVYGYLSNDPVNISTDSSGTILVTVNNALVASPTTIQQNTAWNTATTGVYKVYNDNAEVTAANTLTLAYDGSVIGPRYSIKSGSYTGSLTSSNTTINSITGEYKITNGTTVTDYNNSVIFEAKYNGVIIERTWTVTKGRGGQTAPLIQLSANTTEFIYKQEIDTTSLTTSSVIKARLANITGQIAFTANAYTRAGVSLGPISGTQDQILNTFTITAAQFGYYGVTTGYVLATATSVIDNSVSDTITLYRINDGSNQITVEQTNGSHLITSDALGNTTYNDYDGSGNTISVKKGNKLLLIDNTPGDTYAADTWRIESVVPTNISHDSSYVATQGDNRATFSRVSGMLANVASINYTIRVQLITGDGSSPSQYLDTIVQQSFAKSKAGATGRSVNLTSNYANFTTASGSITVSPSTIVLTATASQYTNPTYTWSIDGSSTLTGATQGTGANVNKLTLNSFTSGNPVPTKLIRVLVSETINGITNEQFDELSIGSLKEGDPGISYNLTNGNQTIYYSSTGTIKAGQLDGTLDTTTPAYFKCVYQVKKGTTNLNGTGAVSFSLASQVGMSAAINASTGVISVATLTSEFASATFYATVDGQVYTQVLTLNRSQDGASAPAINLTGLRTIAFIKAVDNTWSPSTITLSADVFNIPTGTTYYWYVADNEGSFTSVTNGVDLKQYTVNQFTSGTKTYKIEATVNGQIVFDTQTIYSLESGSGGLAIGLLNPSQNISSSALGVPVSGVNITTNLVVYKGTDQVTSGLTFSATAYSGLNATGIAGYTNTINSTGAISVPSSYFDTSSGINQISITYRVTGTNIDASRTLLINKTRDGATGNSIYVATVYKVSASNPGYPSGSTGPTGGSYNFNGNILTAPSGWSATQPATTSTPTWACDYTFVGAPTATITATQWSDVYVEAQSGTNGEYRDIIELYLTAAAIPTPTPPFSATYYFSNNTISVSGGTSGWSMTQPQSSTTPTWMTKSLATTTTPTDGVTLTTWSSPIIVAQNGTNGTNGTSAANFYITNTSALFTKDKEGTVSPSSGIVLNTASTNITSIVGYQWTKDGTNISGATSNSYTVLASEFSSILSATYAVTVTGTINGVAGQTRSDSITVARLDSATNNPTINATNDNITFNGPTGTSYSGITFSQGVCTFSAYLGSQQLTYGTSGANTFSIALGTPVGISVTSSGDTVSAPTAMSSDYAYVDVTVTLRNSLGTTAANIVRRITYTLARAGAKGDAGTSTYTATIYLLSSSYPSALGTPPPAPIGGTYSFSNSTLVAPAGGWLVSQPESSAFYPTWAADYTFTTTTLTEPVGGGQWGNRRVLITVPKEGTPGARNATGFLYSQVSATSPPSVATPDPATWSWTTGQFGNPSTTGSWAHTPISPAAGQKAYAVRYNVTESAYGVTPVSVQLGTVITSITFDGLVTFTDLSAKADSSSITGTANTAITNSISSGTIKTALDTKISTGGGATDINNYRTTTTILGSAITTGTIEANALKIGDTSRVGARIEITNTNMTVYSAGTTTYPNGVKRVIIGFLG
jgi:hypothetical protein